MASLKVDFFQLSHPEVALDKITLDIRQFYFCGPLVASPAVASAASTLAPLGGVASLGAPTPGNPGNRGMEATLGLRASPAACRTGGQLSSPKSAGTQVQLGRRSCFHFRA